MANDARVYVTQIPHRRDSATGTFVPVFNLHPAEEFGRLEIMMPPRAAYIGTAELLQQVQERLADYSYERGDAVLLLGDTSIVAATVATLARRPGAKFCVLRWDRLIQRYSRVVFTL